MAREAKAKEASCCEDRIIVTGAVIRHNTCRQAGRGKKNKTSGNVVETQLKRQNGSWGGGKQSRVTASGGASSFTGQRRQR